MDEYKCQFCGQLSATPVIRCHHCGFRRLPSNPSEEKVKSLVFPIVSYPEYLMFGTYRTNAKSVEFTADGLKLTSVAPNSLTEKNFKYHLMIPFIEMKQLLYCTAPFLPVLFVRPTKESNDKIQDCLDLGKTSPNGHKFDINSKETREQFIIIKLKEKIGESFVRALNRCSQTNGLFECKEIQSDTARRLLEKTQNRPATSNTEQRFQQVIKSSAMTTPPDRYTNPYKCLKASTETDSSSSAQRSHSSNRRSVLIESQSILSFERQKVMAAQIALRRRQQQQEEMKEESAQTSTRSTTTAQNNVRNNSESVCTYNGRDFEEDFGDNSADIEFNNESDSSSENSESDESMPQKVAEFEQILRNRGLDPKNLMYFLLHAILGANDKNPTKSANKVLETIGKVSNSLLPINKPKHKTKIVPKQRTEKLNSNEWTMSLIPSLKPIDAKTNQTNSNNNVNSSHPIPTHSAPILLNSIANISSTIPCPNPSSSMGSMLSVVDYNII